MSNHVQNQLAIYLDQQLIAHLQLEDELWHWNYLPEWQEMGFPLSPYLPFNIEIPTKNVQRYIRNLLPEGPCLEELSQIFQISKLNTFALIRALGTDTAGALIIMPAEVTLSTSPAFRLISETELIQRLDQREYYGLLVWDGKPRLSVAGVQDKINIILEPQGQIGFGEGSLCSTHILKFEKNPESHLVLNECYSMHLAKQCGLRVANVSMKRFGKYPILLVERFDRHLLSPTLVARSHIIDGCQACNLPPEYKYERIFGNTPDVKDIRDGVNFKKLFDFSNDCDNPALVKLQLIDWMIFNLLIANFDAHGKNISFFVDKNGMSLTPFYDLVNIKLYPEFDHEMAMAIGDEFDAEKVQAYHLADFADTCSVPRSLLVSRFERMIAKLSAALTHQQPDWNLTPLELQFIEKYAQVVKNRMSALQRQLQWVISITV